MTLDERARAVQSREDFCAFLEAFAADFTVNRDEWENAEMDQFLEALAGYSRDIDGTYANAGEDMRALSPWRVVADMLMGARTYE